MTREDWRKNATLSVELKSILESSTFRHALSVLENENPLRISAAVDITGAANITTNGQALAGLEAGWQRFLMRLKSLAEPYVEPEHKPLESSYLNEREEITE